VSKHRRGDVRQPVADYHVPQVDPIDERGATREQPRDPAPGARGRKLTEANRALLKERLGLDDRGHPKQWAPTLPFFPCARCEIVALEVGTQAVVCYGTPVAKGLAYLECRACGHTAHADINAARNLRARATVNWPQVTEPHKTLLIA